MKNLARDRRLHRCLPGHISVRHAPTTTAPLSIAVIGDWPYSQFLLDNAHLLVNAINDDKDVSS